VSLLLISELAERSGVPVSTLRYYERIGLVEPSCRADNNYREYDEAALDRLAFIARAKRLGMSLDDVATLMEAWFAGECEPLRDRLKAFVTGRIGDLRRQMAEDHAFEGQLERILARLSNPGPATRRCAPDCGCDTDPLEVTDLDVAGIGCSLGAIDIERRVSDWRRLLASAKGRERGDGTFRAVFDPSAGLITEVVDLCRAEIACCPFFTFDVQISASAVAVTISGPDDALSLITAVFDPVAGWGAPQPIGTRAGEDPVPPSVAPGAAGYFPVPAPAAPHRSPRPRSQAQAATR
jgi:MerR family copper efflux transcriptional regulator